MPNEPKWTPPKLIVKALINPPAWGIYTADEPNEQKAFICDIRPWMIEGRDCVPRKDAKQYADLFVASPELLEALEPDDRLNAGGVIHRGYKSTSAIETVHLLHCCLAQVLEHPERFDSHMAHNVKDEIQRLIDRAEKALAKARKEQSHAE